MTPARAKGAMRPLVSRLSLRAKLVLGFAMPMAGMCLFILFYFPARFERESLAALRAKAGAIAAMTAYGVAPALYFDDRTGLNEAVEPALRNLDVSFIEIRDPAGRVVEHWHGPARAEEPDLVDVQEPIAFRSGSGGTLTVGLSAAAVRADVRRSRAHGAALSGTIFLLGLAGIVAMSGIIVRPVRRIAGAAQRIAGGDLSLRVDYQSGDELGALAHAFDAMVEHLVRAQDALLSINRDLEARVETRTAELRAEIGERERAEEELRASESRMRAVFESAALGMLLLDAEGRIVDGNPAMARMVAVPVSEWVGQRFTDLVVPESLAQAVPLLPPAALFVAPPESAEFSLRGPGGAIVSVRAAASVVPTGPGGRPGVILVLADVTRQRELEARVQEARKLEAVGRLAGGVAHDFNNLLATINGITELLIDEAPAGSRAAADLRDIRLAGERAAGLTRQLLAFGRRQILRRVPVDINDVVRDTLAGSDLGEHIRVTREFTCPIPPVLTDPSLMQEVLAVLVGNAADAMSGGGHLTLRTFVEDVTPEVAREVSLGAPGPHVLIEVQDTGTGMDARTLERIFEPFFTTKHAEARMVGRGAGLGLASVYGILRQSGGAVAARSEVGRGSVFRVFLPVHVPLREMDQGDGHEPTRRGASLEALGT
jgi:PAS domain S-box-containing protein